MFYLFIFSSTWPAYFQRVWKESIYEFHVAQNAYFASPSLTQPETIADAQRILILHLIEHPVFPRCSTLNVVSLYSCWISHRKWSDHHNFLVFSTSYIDQNYQMPVGNLYTSYTVLTPTQPTVLQLFLMLYRFSHILSHPRLWADQVYWLRWFFVNSNTGPSCPSPKISSSVYGLSFVSSCNTTSWVSYG